MKVMHIVSGLAQGGAEAVLCNLVLETNDLQHMVVCLTNHSYYGDRLQRSGVPVVYLGMRGTTIASAFRLLIKIIKDYQPGYFCLSPKNVKLA